MDAVLLARIQFALTICFHFIFPAITMGLGPLLCLVEWFAIYRVFRGPARLGGH